MTEKSEENGEVHALHETVEKGKDCHNGSTIFIGTGQSLSTRNKLWKTATVYYCYFCHVRIVFYLH